VNGEGEDKSVSALKRGEVRYSGLKDGRKGVVVGEEDIFVHAEFNGKWRFRLYDMFTGDSLTGPLSLKKPEGLRLPVLNKPFKNALKKRFSNVEEVLEWIISEVEDHKDEWLSKEESNEDETEEEGNRANVGVQEAPSIPVEVLDKEVEGILNAEKPDEALKPHLDNVIAGEDENKLPIFTLLGSGKISDPQMKQIILLKGTEGAGKTRLMSLANAFKVKEVGRFTAHALDYSKLEGFEVLKLKEIGVLDEEKQGVATIKFLSSDDRGYTVEATIRDRETGELVTKEYKIPPITVISSTTTVELDKQFERRAWIFNPDESSEQTKVVLEWKAKLEREKDEVALGLKPYTSYDFSMAVLKRLAERLQPTLIIAPYHDTVKEILGFDVLRVRGDYDKLEAFIKLFGLLYQRRLPELKVGDRTAKLVTPEVCARAVQLALKPLAKMMAKLEERTKRLLETFKEEGVSEKDPVITKEKRDALARRLGVDDRTIRRWLGGLVAAGYLSESDTKPKTYTLLCSVEEIIGKILGKLDTWQKTDFLIKKLTEEARKWLKTGLDNLTSTDKAHIYRLLESLDVKANSGSSNMCCASQEVRLSNPELSPSEGDFSKSDSKNWTPAQCPTCRGEKDKVQMEKPSEPKRLTIQDALPLLKRKDGFATIEAFVDRACQVAGWTQEEAYRAFQILEREGWIAKDPRGVYSWTNQPQPSGTVQGTVEVQGVTLSPEEVKQIVRLDKPCVDKCFLCGKKASLHWKVETFKGEWGLLCEECAGKLLSEQKDSQDEGLEG